MSYKFNPENPFRDKQTRSETAAGTSESVGLRMEHFFSTPGTHPFEQLEWERRSAKITGDNGQVIFEQDNIEVPASWSQLAAKVVASKYFYGDIESGQREHSVKQLIHRVCKTIADRGRKDGYFATDEDAEIFYNELAWLCVNQCGAFNSPVWFNVGLFDVYGIAGSGHNFHWDPEHKGAVACENSYEYPQASACFIQSVKDSMEDIMRLAASEAMLFKHGSGTGTDLSTLRSSKEKLSGGGKPSGPLSFMRVYDQIAAVIKSGGKTRRAAKMQSLKVSHPDIKEFITCKAEEEKKAWALIEAGYNGEYNQQAYSSVMFQNSNFSVRVTDEFMQAVEKDDKWTTYAVTTGEKVGEHSARKLMELIADGTRICGDPGLQYHSTINRWHTCPNSGPINSSNPCSEYMFLDDSACNLASLNLMKFRKEDGSFDVASFRNAVRLFVIAQEILVDNGRNAARDAWDQAFDAGSKVGFRNAQATVLAPTGTIGFMMDCDTTGVEPDIALVKYKLLAGGGMLKLVNKTVSMALERLGYNAEDIKSICDYIDTNETIEGAEKLNPDHLSVFDCAFKPRNGKRHIHYIAHLKMMAAVQPFISGAISKTINMPKESTTEEIAAAYTEGWKLGLKAVAIYRDGSKKLQPVSTQKHKETKAKAAAEGPAPSRPFRHRLPDTRQSVTHKFSVTGHEGYLTVGLYEDGQPGEVFITMAKEGSTVGGLMDVIGTCTSMALQYGVPLITLVDKFRHARFEPSGMTSNRDIPFAKSLIDYIFCWLGCRFIPGYAEQNTPNRAAVPGAKESKNTTTARQLVEKTKDLAQKIVEAKTAVKVKEKIVPLEKDSVSSKQPTGQPSPAAKSRFAGLANRIGALVSSAAADEAGPSQSEAAVMQQFNAQFEHFQDDAPACDICGAITVRNGSCYKCFNCGNSMGCS